MFVEFIYFSAGLLVLILGGEALIRGASSLAASAGISPLIVGLTVVAFGTSAPELVVSVMAALKGSSGITFGNVVGSNIANISLLLGVCAVMRKLQVESTIVSREIPMMILACAAIAALGMDSSLGGIEDILTRGDGLMLLLLFGVFIYYTIRDVFQGSLPKDPLLADIKESQETRAEFTVLLGGVFVALGVFGLFLGGTLSVNAAVAIARTMGISEMLIGVTLVAVGTSLPELVTSIQATRKGMPDLVIGNIVGSNIFNTLFVLGSTAMVQPVEIPRSGWQDITIMFLLSVMLLRFAITDTRRLIRREGQALLVFYVCFLMWQMFR